MTDKLTQAAALTRAIADKESRAAGLLEELNKSLAIESLWPDIFTTARPLSGRITSRWHQSRFTLIFRVMLWGPERPGGRALIEARTFARPIVPAILDNETATADAREHARRAGIIRAFDARKI